MKNGRRLLWEEKTNRNNRMENVEFSKKAGELESEENRT